MYEIGVSAQFEAAHALRGDFGPATRLHGHTYRLDVIVRGERLDSEGALYDIGKLRTAVDALAGSLNYRNLNEVSDLAGVNSTAEAVAQYCWLTLAPQLRGKALTS